MDPIFFKELRGATSKNRLWILRLLSAAALCLVIGLGYHFNLANKAVTQKSGMSAGENSSRGETSGEELRGAAVGAEIAAAGKQIFQYFSWCQLALILIMVPIFAGASITGEKECKTLDLLLCSPLSAWRIVTGKMKLCFMSSLALLLAGTPLMFAVSFFGGVDIVQMGGMAFLCIFGALLASSISIYASALFETTSRAILSSVLILLALQVIDVFLYMTKIPIMPMMGLMALLEAGQSEAWIKALLIPVIFMSVMSLFFLRMAASVLYNRSTIEIVHRMEERRRKMIRRTSYKDSFGVNIPNLIMNFDERFTNPIMFRDQKMGFWGGLSFFTKIMMLYLIIVGLVGLGSAMSQSPLNTDILSFLLVVPAIFIMIFAAYSTPIVIGKEFELKTMESLLTTPMNEREIVQGKLLGLVRNFIILWTFYVPLIVLFSFVKLVHPVAGVMLLCGVIIYPMFAGVLGMFFGAYCRDSMRGTAYSLLVLFGMTFGGFLLKTIFFTGPEYADSAWRFVPELISPIYAMMFSIQNGWSIDFYQIFFLPIVLCFLLGTYVLYVITPRMIASEG